MVTQIGLVALLVGAGDAIGAAVARRFAMEGYKVCIARQDAGKSQTLIEELQMAGIDIEAFSVDARKEGEVPPVRKGDFDVPQLLSEVLVRLRDDLRCYPVDASQSCCAVPPHHVQARGVQLGNNVKAPFQPDEEIAPGWRHERVLRARIGPGKVGDNGTTFTDREITILKQRNFLARIQYRILCRLNGTPTRANGPRLVRKTKLVEGPMSTDGTGRPNSPEHKGRPLHLTTSPRLAVDPVRASIHPLSADGRTNTLQPRMKSP